MLFRIFGLLWVWLSVISKCLADKTGVGGAVASAIVGKKKNAEFTQSIHYCSGVPGDA